MPSTASIRVLIADEQPLFAHGLQKVFEEAGGFEVVARTTSAGDALKLCASLRPNLAFLDAALTGPEYATLVRMTSETEGEVPSVILLVPGHADGVRRDALFRGARGILPRTAPTGVVEKAARCVAAGQYWVDREAVGDMVRWLREAKPAPDGRAKPPVAKTRLTLREREVVAAVVAGHCNKEIAARLSISDDTVKHHLTSIFVKLRVSTRLELAVQAIQNGLAEPRL